VQNGPNSRLDRFYSEKGELLMVDFLISWGPILLLIAVWIYFMKKGGALNYPKHVQEMKDLASAQLDEMKATNAALARIEQLLREQRS
jgi:hypothetical protein